MRLIDLHTHTTRSDGTFTPTDLAREVRAKGLSAFALTDHDCVDGIEEACKEADGVGVELIPGVEISAEFEKGIMHVLGYFIDWRHTHFLEKLKVLQEGRKERNPQIVRKLRDLGMEITYEEVVAASGGGQVGRPHFARVLMQKGYVTSIQEAFDKYLKKGAPAFLEKERFSPEEAIALIHEAGGVAVLAHPGTLSMTRLELPPLFESLSDAGLDGVEVYYSLHSEADVAFYLPLLKRLHLLPTGGSDFHGANKPDIMVGSGKGNLRVEYDLLPPLRERRRQPVLS